MAASQFFDDRSRPYLNLSSSVVSSGKALRKRKKYSYQNQIGGRSVHTASKPTWKIFLTPPHSPGILHHHAGTGK